MSYENIAKMIDKVDMERMKSRLFYMSKDPLPYRKVNYTIPGNTKNSLEEADDFIAQNLETAGYTVEREECKAQAFRRDTSKPLKSQFSPPKPEDPWYSIYNLYAKKTGNKYPDEIIVFISHKDSQSWIDSPGAYDNAVGTVANMEIAEVLAGYPSQRSMWFIFCNEEHTPWTSVTAAKKSKERGDNIIAVINIDSLGGKSQEDTDAGKKTNVTLFTEPEGEWLVDIVTEANDKFAIGLDHRKAKRETPGDDDGSYIKEGYLSAIVNVGSSPYADPNYHAPSDKPHVVDIENVYMSTRLTLAAGLMVDMR
ncbi:M28 family peptidase [Candidatus Poribacteria bacterium]|nr:M28 family peptidase [Candidatus Poribacteria bacterium]